MLCTRGVEPESSEPEEMDTSEARWCWFYLAECGVWHMFEMDESTACSVTSEQIEQNYCRNQQGVMEFYTAKYTYRLDFSVMKQVNVTTGKQRPIKRALHSVTGFRFICDNLALPVPAHWERINTEEPYQLVALGRDTFEYKEVARLFEMTMGAPIKSIQRIQNLDLWEFFCRKKAQLIKIKRITDIEEKMLFHGTGYSNVQAICTYNFDWRLTGSHGDVYGKGSYFARDAKYSRNSKFENMSIHCNKVGSSDHISDVEAMDTSDSPWCWFYLAECGTWHMFKAVPLYRDTFEYQEIRRLFERTMDAPIKTIHRIQNLDLWEFFCRVNIFCYLLVFRRKKAQLKKLNRALNIEEKKLFHGTDHENVHPICKYNFDLRLSGMHGRVYGKGIYFARDAKYSSKYCQTTWNTSLTTSSVGSSTSWKTVFLARVLVGEYTLGERDICRPPSKDSTSFYDSCVDDVANPKIFVIFDSSQIYPEYVIEF
ncbi:poly-like [Scleropages formosus]|uniref:Poly [ADP-ribose] polymerase n=1 Tax=Scleropages formosus TaxID=113540 RepID=A0A0P7UAH8_SCLFO|nr:poly-like [Scleropages formosus]